MSNSPSLPEQVVERSQPWLASGDRRKRLLDTRGTRLVIDVGANEGQYAHRLRDAGYDGRIVSVEPLSGPFEQLKRRSTSDPNWHCRRIALADKEGIQLMKLRRDSQASSVLEVAPAFMKRLARSSTDYLEPVGVEPVVARTLDSLLPDLAAPGDNPYLKIDVQGYELHVLRGAERSLKDLALIEVELSFVPLYVGAPLFDDVAAFLRARGFRLFSLEDGWEDSRSGELLQIDAIFVPR
jgi:FkbM family methyltransferase